MSAGASPYAAYAALHAAIRSGELPPRYLLFHVQDGVGGYADRLKGLANALLLALLLDRALLVHWPVPAPLAQALPPAGIDWRPEGAAGLEGLLPWKRSLDWTSIVQPGAVPFLNLIDSERLEPMLGVLEQGDPEAQWLCGAPVAALSSNVLFHKAVLGNPLFRAKAREIGLAADSFLSRHFGEFFRLCFGDPLDHGPGDGASPLARHGAPFLAAFRQAASQGRPVLGIQIRTGGEGAWDDPCFMRRDEAEVFFRQAQALDEPGTPPALWFLETDSQALKDAACAQYGERILTTDWPISHIDRSPGRQGLDMERTMAKHLLLARCHSLLLGAGGFGLTAAWLGNVPYRMYPGFEAQRP